MIKIIKEQNKKITDSLNEVKDIVSYAKNVESKELLRDDFCHISEILITKKNIGIGEHEHILSYEYIVCIEGIVELYINKKTYLLHEGEGLRLEKGIAHSGKSISEKARVITICIPSDNDCNIFRKILSAYKNDTIQ